jgi:hypothetical protein
LYEVRDPNLVGLSGFGQLDVTDERRERELELTTDDHLSQTHLATNPTRPSLVAHPVRWHTLRILHRNTTLASRSSMRPSSSNKPSSSRDRLRNRTCPSFSSQQAVSHTQHLSRSSARSLVFFAHQMTIRSSSGRRGPVSAGGRSRMQTRSVPVRAHTSPGNSRP